MDINIKEYPYLGKHAEPTARVHIVELSLEDMHEYLTTQEFADDPMMVFINKVEHLAELLGCSERDAERLLFKRLGS